MYVPIEKLEKYMLMPKAKLEVNLLKSIYEKQDKTEEEET